MSTPTMIELTQNMRPVVVQFGNDSKQILYLRIEGVRFRCKNSGTRLCTGCIALANSDAKHRCVFCIRQY